MSILEKLFDGEFSPYDDLNKRCPDKNKFYEEIDEMTVEWLKKKIDKSEHEKLEEFDTLYMKLSDLREKKSFIYGFKTGMLMMNEILSSVEN